jgi:signal transduction histidine kinase
VRLTDSGWGIPAEDLPHIFDTFYRGQNVVSEGFEGSGLGLALAKAVVEAHDGKIDVESREGEGTSVTVRLDAEGGMTGPS